MEVNFQPDATSASAARTRCKSILEGALQVSVLSGLLGQPDACGLRRLCKNESFLRRRTPADMPLATFKQLPVQHGAATGQPFGLFNQKSSKKSYSTVM